MTTTRRHDERGDTLIEILLTVMIMGIAGSALLGAMLLSSQTSSLHRQQAQAQNLLRSWAEQVTSSTYMVCATPTVNAFAAAPAMPTSFKTPKVAQVLYWRKDSAGVFDWRTGSGSGGACVPASDDHGAQKVTLQVTSTNGSYVGVDSTLDVVVTR